MVWPCVGAEDAPQPNPNAAQPTDSSDKEPVEVSKKLERKVSFDFQETPLEETLSFMRSLSYANMVLDPALTKDKQPIVTLKVQDAPLREALGKVLEASGTGAKLWYIDGAFWISKDAPLRDLRLKPEPIPALTKEQQEILKKALTDFASEDFDVRETALKKVRDIGTASIPALEEASRKEGDDLERHNCVLNVLAELRAKAHLGDLNAAALACLQRKVSFEFVGTPLVESAAFIIALSGIDLQVADGVKAATLSLRVKDMEMEQVIRWMARLGSAKLDCQDHTIRIVK